MNTTRSLGWITSLAIALVAVLSPSQAQACQCVEVRPATAMAGEESWPAVLDGEVASIERVERRGALFDRAEVRVRRVLRGAERDATIIVYVTAVDHCPRIELEVGRRYLLMLTADWIETTDPRPFALAGCNPSLEWREGPWTRAFERALARSRRHR